MFSSQLAEDAGFPPGVINTIPCSRNHVDQVTDALLGNDLVAKMSFTGSTATGKVNRQLKQATSMKFQFWNYPKKQKLVQEIRKFAI